MVKFLSLYQLSVVYVKFIKVKDLRSKEEKKEKSKNSMSIYVPKGRREEELKEKMERLAEERDRSMNYLLLEALDRYLEEEDENGQGGDRY